MRFSSANNFNVQKSRLRVKLKSFSEFGMRLWNCLHHDWHKLTQKAFKTNIHKLLLTVLGIEDYYVDAHSNFNFFFHSWNSIPIQFSLLSSLLGLYLITCCLYDNCTYLLAYNAGFQQTNIPIIGPLFKAGFLSHKCWFYYCSKKCWNPWPCPFKLMCKMY